VNTLSEGNAGLVARTVGNSIGPGVTALCAIAGIPFGAPGVVLGAAAGALAEEAVSRLWANRRNGVERFAIEAEVNAEEPIESLIESAVNNPQLFEMLARAVDAAARSADRGKIDLLAGIFVRAVRDPEKVDAANILLDATTQLEPPHVRLLRILSRPGPHLVPGRPTGDGPRTPETMARIASWRVEDILAADDGLGGVFDALIGKLQTLGLVYDEGSGRLDYEPLWFLTKLGRSCAQFLSERGTIRPTSLADR